MFRMLCILLVASTTFTLTSADIPPDVITSETEITVVEGDEAVFPWITSGYITEYNWKKGANDIMFCTIGNDGEPIGSYIGRIEHIDAPASAEMVILKTRLEDAGEYTVTAIGTAGRKESTITLKVTPMPEEAATDAPNAEPVPEEAATDAPNAEPEKKAGLASVKESSLVLIFVLTLMGWFFA